MSVSFRTAGSAFNVLFAIVVLSSGVACSASASDSNARGGTSGDPGTGGSAGDGGVTGDASVPEEPCGPPGTLDTAFGTSGTLVSETAKASYSDKLGVISDGAVGLYVGFSPPGTQSAPSTSLGVTHLDATGKLDSAFGTNGTAIASFPHVDGFVSVQRGAETGAIYVVGDTTETDAKGSTHFGSAIVRFTASGQLDTTFGGDGHVQVGGLTGIPDHVAVKGVMERADGSLVMATNAGLAVLTPTGQQTSFVSGPNEVVDDWIHIAPLAEDTFLIVGLWADIADIGADVVPKSARYTAEVKLDTSYGSQGQASAAIKGSGAGSWWPNAVRADGTLALGGYDAIAVLDAHGHSVGTFGQSGSAMVDSPVVATLLREDGSVVYATVPPPMGPSITVRALTAAGTTDAAFGQSGSLSVPKTIMRPTGATVQAEYVGPAAIVSAGTRRAYLVSTYNALDDRGMPFSAVYLARFCTRQ